jgi:hypothetical protein
MDDIPYRRIRVTGGPEPWSYRVEDIESGEILPVRDVKFRFDTLFDFAVAELTLYVHEFDIQADAQRIGEGARDSRGERIASFYYGGGSEKLIDADDAEPAKDGEKKA